MRKQRIWKMLKRNTRRTLDVFNAIGKQRSGEFLACHKKRLTTLPASLILPLLCGHVKGRLKCPSHLTILLIHNYNYMPIAERSLRYVGINNFKVLKVAFNGQWRNTLKLLELKKFLDSGDCKTEYLIFFDSNDVVLRDDPKKAIEYLQGEDCDLLFSNTEFAGGYECMPGVREWTDQIAREKGYGKRYINSGVYIGKTSFLREVISAATAYVTDHDLTPEEYKNLRRKGVLSENLPSFPYGVGSDQVIFRYLHPKFYPKMKLDYEGKLALRR